ncbi:hypothetical protein GCM10011575_43650 [Microlunatus endophyticus]|uniref:SurA N-terminal domain-containing protein n=1 Tax=Microlunatus endophyticus TaxID=1716077 RepID=A0A917SG93_9ACTN|nr:hypothetical protein GCM10011575_43650 [Microlunatus endophyticus]
MRLIAVAGVLSGAAVLGGCAQTGAVAATVDGTRISTSDVDQTFAGAQEVSLGSSQQVTKDQVLSIMIQATVADQVARQRGITITDADRDKQLNPAVLDIADAHDFAYDVADIQVVSGAIGESALAKAVAAADVRVNPRLGSWDPKQSVNVVPGVASLSQVAQNRPQ